MIKNQEGNIRFDNESFQVTGRVDHVNVRFAFVIPEDGAKDIWVATGDLNNAKDGDKVIVQARRPSEKRKNDRPEGEVVQILERRSAELVGVIQVTPHYSFLIPDSKKIYEDVYLPKFEIKDAKHLDKVIVEVTRWGSDGKKAEGRVIKVLGKAGENDTEMHSILAEYGLPYDFPEEVEKAAASILVQIPATEIKKRKDMRNVLTFTIDPIDAKDFDDAISYQKLKNGNTEIGVHIAPFFCFALQHHKGMREGRAKLMRIKRKDDLRCRRGRQQKEGEDHPQNSHWRDRLLWLRGFLRI